MDMTHNKCCRHGANLRRRRRRRGKILRFIIFSCSIIAVAVFVAVGSRMIRSGDGRTNKYDVEAGNNTYDNAVIENSKISEKNKIQNNQSMLDDIMNSTQYPKQLKDLALKNEEALEFVYDYPAEHVKEHTIDLTEEASMDSVPLFVQWDKRWGYEKYSGNFFAASGCGPTTLSMVVVYLTHNREASPIAVAKYSKEAGYSVDGSGSSWTLISEGCRHYGVKAKTVALDESRMKAELDAGHPIVINVGPGDFTDTGHFMVITGYDDEGFSINDAFSIHASIISIISRYLIFLFKNSATALSFAALKAVGILPPALAAFMARASPLKVSRSGASKVRSLSLKRSSLSPESAGLLG